VYVHDNEILKRKKCEKSLHIPPNIDYDNMNMRCLHSFNNYIKKNKSTYKLVVFDFWVYFTMLSP